MEDIIPSMINQTPYHCVSPPSSNADLFWLEGGATSPHSFATCGAMDSSIRTVLNIWQLFIAIFWVFMAVHPSVSLQS